MEITLKSIIATLVLVFAAAGSGANAAEFSEAELVNLGQSFARALNRQDAEALDALMSDRHLAQKIAEIAGDNAEEKQQLVRAFEAVIPRFNRGILTELDRQNSEAVFLRVHEFEDMRGPLVRYSVGDGYNYALLIPVRTANAIPATQISDMYYATSGEMVSETMGITARLLSSPSETFLEKLLGAKAVDRELASRFQEIGQLRQQNRLGEAFDLLDQIQGDARNHRLILMNTIQIASQLNEELYRQELRRLAKYHKDDPRAAFTLLDHYFYENDFDSAMSIIDLMERTYGDDAVLNIFRASVELARNRTDLALRFAATATELEPGNEDAHWTRVTILVQSEMFAECVAALQLLESQFGYSFAREDFDVDPLYTDFVKSEAFARWIDAP